MGAKFSSIELEIYSNSDLSVLATALDEPIGANYCGPAQGQEQWANFYSGSYSGPFDEEVPLEISDSEKPFEQGIEFAASRLCDILESLEPDAKQGWEAAGDRVFDVGLDANTDRIVIINFFSPETLRRIADLGVRLAVSVYATDLSHEIGRLKSQLK